jgi:hypothetical protein
MLFLNRSTQKPTELLTQKDRTFWNPIYRVETNAYVLCICDHLFASYEEYSVIENYINNGIPDGFVAPETKDTSLHKRHDPKFEPSPYKDLISPDYRPHSTYNMSVEDRTFKLRLYEVLITAIDFANVSIIRYLKAHYFDKYDGIIADRLDPDWKPHDMAYDCLDLAVENWSSINLYIYKKQVDSTNLHMLEYYYDTIVAVLDLGSKNEYALRHLAHYFKDTEDYTMLDLFIKRYDFNAGLLLYQSVLWDYINVFNDVINQYKYWLDFGCLLEAMNQSDSYGNKFIRKIVCDKLINMGPYFYIPLATKYPEFHYYRLFYCALREYSKTHGVENTAKNTYIMSEETRKYVAKYIKEHSTIKIEECIDAPLVGFTCPDNLYTSTMALYRNKHLNNKIELRHIDDFEYY